MRVPMTIGLDDQYNPVTITINHKGYLCEITDPDGRTIGGVRKCTVVMEVGNITTATLELYPGAVRGSGIQTATIKHRRKPKRLPLGDRWDNA